MNIPKVLGIAFFVEQLWWLLLNCFSITKEFLKRKVSRDIAFDLISLFHVQIQEPTSRSTTTRAFIFLAKFAEFYYHKIFVKQEYIDDDLSNCVNEHSSCGLAISGDIKINQCHMIKR